MTKTIVTYTNRKTNKEYTFEGYINEGTTAVLVDAEGGKHMYALSTLKKNYKRTEKEIEIEDKPLTKHQKAAMENIEGAYTYVMGGYENSLQDGEIEELPAVEILFEDVYIEATKSGHRMVGGIRIDGGAAPIWVRLAGRAFVREAIAKIFREDGYTVPEELLSIPTKKRTHSNIVDGERVNLRIDAAENTVEVRAFTGMLIGYFKVEKQTSKTITVKTHKGHMKFDRKTGIQITEKKKFANRITL